MIAPPSALMTEYKKCLQSSGIAVRLHTSFQKWFRFYWDFCSKYQREPGEHENLAGFIDKLKDKKQNVAQQAEAKGAVEKFFQVLRNQGNKPVIQRPTMKLAIPDMHAQIPSLSSEGQAPLPNLAHHSVAPPSLPT